MSIKMYNCIYHILFIEINLRSEENVGGETILKT